MKEKMFSLAAAVLFVIAAAVSWSDGFDWPRWRGPDGDGISKRRIGTRARSREMDKSSGR